MRDERMREWKKRMPGRREEGMTCQRQWEEGRERERERGRPTETKDWQKWKKKRRKKEEGG